MVTELKTRHELDDTTIILSAKHGQSPVASSALIASRRHQSSTASTPRGPPTTRAQPSWSSKPPTTP
jgi:hypothetical protein